jgi:uncharacterized protein (TIGR00299 family) protein
MSKVLYFDCFSGASGDMILGALIDAGLPLGELREALGSLTLGNVRLLAERVERSGIGATSFTVDVGEDAKADAHSHEHHHHDHDHHHDAHHHDAHHDDHHHHHHHRGLSEICQMVDGSSLSESAKERSKRLFRRLAETEAEIHQMPVEKVHLHEVGAVDSIIDIAGAVFGLERLGVDRIVVSPLNVGSGTVRCEHGVMPVPAPATARLIEGVPVYSSGPAVELLTPTGALILTDYADAFGTMPPMTIRQSGYGAGDREFPEHPNLLRVLIGDEETAGGIERIVTIECEIDDMNPQIFGVLMDRLYAAGALDVYYVPIQMKKNRPGTLVSIVARPKDRSALSGIVFRETTTSGVRFIEMARERLDRESVDVETPLGTVRVKVARRAGASAVVNAAPEFEDCARLASEHDLSVKEVQAIVNKAYLDRTGQD